MAKGRILAIDDEKFFRHFYQDLLTSEGYQVRTVSSGEEALEIVCTEEYDLIITDMHMPGMDGVETTARIRAVRPDQDVMVVTGQKDVEKAVAAMKGGVSEYLLKPINPDEFLHVVGQMLYRQVLSQEHNKLLSENVEYNSVLAAHRRCLEFLKVCDLDRLGDLILDTLMDLLHCEGALLWLQAGEGRAFRHHCHRGLVHGVDETFAPEPGPEQQKTLVGGEALHFHDGRRLWLPLLLEKKLIGLIQLEAPMGRSAFTRADLKVALAASEFAAAALNAAQRYKRAGDGSLRAGQGEAYHMAYFRDCFERELQKARRFVRSLSLLRFRVANYVELQASFRDREVSTMVAALLNRVHKVLRDADVLAMADSDDFYVLLPETDFWGALLTQRRIRKAIKDLAVSDLKNSMPVDVHLRAASMPVDGWNFEDLSHVLQDRLDALPRSLVLRKSLDSCGFWKGVEGVLGNPRDYRLAEGALQVPASFADCQDGRFARYVRMPAGFIDEMTRTFIMEAAEPRRSRGVIYRSCADFEAVRKSLGSLQVLEKTAATLCLLGGGQRVQWDYQRTIPIFIKDAFLRKVSFLLYLTEDQAYALFAWRKGEELIGFHCADYFFVETMVAKVQEHYRLQEPA